MSPFACDGIASLGLSVEKKKLDPNQHCPTAKVICGKTCEKIFAYERIGDLERSIGEGGAYVYGSLYMGGCVTKGGEKKKKGKREVTVSEMGFRYIEALRGSFSI